MRTLCLGEALVDLVCEHPVAAFAEAATFTRRPGGAMANACVAAARAGGDVALAGGAGDDAWGAWLRDNLAAEGVALDWFALVEGEPTALAFVTVDAAGEPAFHLRGGELEVVAALGERLDDAVDACGALVLASNTLVGEADRAATLAARGRALEQGKPVVVEASLRLHRWPHPGRAASVVRECVEEAFLVKCNRAEAAMLTGESDPEAAAAGLLAGGARHVVVTLGARGAILRGDVRRDVAAASARSVDATGAGDVFLGTLLARLEASDFYGPTLAAALPEAAAAGARATERWGAV